jgi:hypothetical protein
MLKKEQMRQWLSHRLKNQRRLTLGAVVVMSLLGAVATLAEFFVFYLILKIGFVGSGFLAFLLSLLILAALQMLIWALVDRQLPETIHEVEVSSGVNAIAVPPNMTAFWTYAFGSLDSDRTWTERLLGFLTLPQRMCAAAWKTWCRAKELETLDLASCAALIRHLHREGEKVPLREIADVLKTDAVAHVIRQALLIDGVILLTGTEIGLSVANRLVDDITEWSAARRAESDAGAE